MEYTKPRDQFVVAMRAECKQVHQAHLSFRLSCSCCSNIRLACKSFAWMATGGHDLKLYKSVLKDLLGDVFGDSDYCSTCHGKCRGGFAAVEIKP